ncbi:site-2 protease family protein [Romboutsia sedimentorum]|uniref:Site-2 protease family protein n=1 Tax=Romboutsia sedimentorum TaxID=1368474 RepID=A0ABT7ECS6_9FIRM|nr:site-2 protease family protein [Romboutsia sedimentorum]MDK2563260.1 site-2 protease family protein [Romboutsia sedimentorum]
MNISNILVSLVAIAVAISVHEFGHAYAAHLLGDDTAKMEGRMTLDPAKHIDPLGLLMMVVVHIGWAKPVPVNPNNFKNYKIGNILVSLSGAIGNILAAILCVVVMKYVRMDAISTIAYTTLMYNVGFAAFNLLPVPPLDGWGIVSSFIPYKYNEMIYKYESISYPILLILIFTGVYGVIVSPIRDVIMNIVWMFY